MDQDKRPKEPKHPFLSQNRYLTIFNTPCAESLRRALYLHRVGGLHPAEHQRWRGILLGVREEIPLVAALGPVLVPTEGVQVPVEPVRQRRLTVNFNRGCMLTGRCALGVPQDGKAAAILLGKL